MFVQICLSLVVTQPVYELDATTDTLATGAGLLALGAVSVLRQTEPFRDRCGGQCNPLHLDELDRYAVGKHSREWDGLTDIGEIVSLVAPLALDALDVGLGATSAGDFLDTFASDALVIVQAQMLAGIVGGLLKITVQRPRPSQYTSRFRRGAVREQSFPSGHALALAAGPTALAVTYWLRHPSSIWRFVVAASTAAFVSVMAWGRVEAGEHFPTDVLAGVGIGAASGLLVPWLHTGTDHVTLSAAPGGIRVTW